MTLAREFNNSQHNSTLNEGDETNERNPSYQLIIHSYISKFISMNSECGIVNERL